MRIAVVGSRDFDDFSLFVKIMDRLRYNKEIDAIITGGARGVDSMAEHYAEVNSIPVIVHEAQWDKYGKGAGYIRNKLIWDDSDFGLAIWDGVSKGTKHSFDLAKKQNKQILIFNYKDRIWVDENGEQVWKKST
jgi:hypothetical protein